jgi:hypothetical protein
MSQVLAMAERIAQLEQSIGLPPDSHGSDDGQDRPESFGPSGPVSTVQHSPVETGSTPQKDTPHYPSTSAIEEPTRGNEDDSSTVEVSPVEVMPSMNQQQLEYWERVAVQTWAAQLHLPADKIEHLFKVHWAWIHHTFIFVPRVPFVRDAASGGRHFSELLFCAICLHSTRFTDHALSEELHARVRLLLGQEIHREMSVPTIQALLQLSARELGKGAISQGWLWSGMAFRAVVDLGIMSKSKVHSTDPELERVKQQLAWSSYVWDKIVSLYLGRVPSLPEQPEFEPPVVDEISELSTWVPYGAESAALNPRPLVTYTYSAFQNYCKLVIIANDVLVGVYCKNRPQQITYFVHQTRQRLHDWYKQTPAHLKADPEGKQCPPPHILTQILLYHATLILLHRPFRGNEQCRTICREAAKEVESLLLLLEKSFGLSFTTYIIAYTAYCAATVALQDLHEGVEGSQTRVNTYLRALYGVRSSCPGIQRSIDIIIRNLEKRAPVVDTHTEAAKTPRLPDLDALPAFPFDANCDLVNFSAGDIDDFGIASMDSFYGIGNTPTWQ